MCSGCDQAHGRLGQVHRSSREGEARLKLGTHAARASPIGWGRRRHARRAVQWPEQPSDATDQEPEPDEPDRRPDAEPETSLRCRARLTEPLGRPDPTRSRPSRRARCRCGPRGLTGAAAAQATIGHQRHAPDPGSLALTAYLSNHSEHLLRNITAKLKLEPWAGVPTHSFTKQ